MSLNLHKIARAAITYNHADEWVELVRSLGQRNVKGSMKAVYDLPEPVLAQVQSASDEGLNHADRYGFNSASRRLWMNVAGDREGQPSGVNRRLARTGDFIRFPDDSWWLVTSVPDDLSGTGWISITCTRQTTPPDLSGCDWRTF